MARTKATVELSTNDVSEEVDVQASTSSDRIETYVTLRHDGKLFRVTRNIDTGEHAVEDITTDS